jgi:hypothetical protein
MAGLDSAGGNKKTLYHGYSREKPANPGIWELFAQGDD